MQLCLSETEIFDLDNASDIKLLKDVINSNPVETIENIFKVIRFPLGYSQSDSTQLDNIIRNDYQHNLLKIIDRISPKDENGLVEKIFVKNGINTF